MPEPPFRPSYLVVLNYVTDVWTAPCEAPWYIYARTLGPAALAALITLATFGWDDVFRGYVRPKSLKSRKFKAKAFRIGGKAIRFPELGELIGRKLPGVKRMTSTRFASQTAFLWRMDGVLQRGLFYWLLADIAVDFTFNWTSAMYETEWCKAGLAARHSNIGSPFQLGVAGGSWHPLNCPSQEYLHGEVAFAVHTWQFGNNRFIFGAGAEFFDHIFQGGRARLRLINLNNPFLNVIGDWVSWEPFGVARPMVVGLADPGSEYEVQWSAETPSTLVKIDKRVAFASAQYPD